MLRKIKLNLSEYKIYNLLCLQLLFYEPSFCTNFHQCPLFYTELSLDMLLYATAACALVDDSFSAPLGLFVVSGALGDSKPVACQSV